MDLVSRAQAGNKLITSRNQAELTALRATARCREENSMLRTASYQRRFYTGNSDYPQNRTLTGYRECNSLRTIGLRHRAQGGRVRFGRFLINTWFLN